MAKGPRGLRFNTIAAMPEGIRLALEKHLASAAPAPAPAADKKKRKYLNQPTVVDGIRFDSKKEARFYEQLKVRKAAGEVSYWHRQTPIHLPGGTRYVVDFLVFFMDPARPPEYVDVKGRQTQVFRVKKREIEHHYPIEIIVS